MYKKSGSINLARILVREAGLEPARPKGTLEPDSSESANSTTRADKVPDYDNIRAFYCQELFDLYVASNE